MARLCCTSITPDCNLVALNLKDGKERWHKRSAIWSSSTTRSVAPMVVKNHVITGVSGDDLDIPGYIESHDPETGALQWRWYAHPEPGDSGSENLAQRRGHDARRRHDLGAQHLRSRSESVSISAPGNPQPVIAGQGRAGVEPIYRMHHRAESRLRASWPWYFQPSPHDTHDWDAVQTPVLFDGEIQRRSRASCWPKPAATDGSSCSTAPTANIS